MAESLQKPSAPDVPNDQPPPYADVMAGNAGGPGTYPHIGFAPPVHTAPPNTYPHPPNTAPPNSYPYPAPNMGPTATYQPPPTGYPQHNVVLGLTQTQVPVNVIVSAPVGPEPTNMFCTGCGQQVTTRVDYRTSWHTHLVAGIICFGTMFFSMCCLGLLPYCINSCKSADHYCPNCDTFLGKYDRC